LLKKAKNYNEHGQTEGIKQIGKESSNKRKRKQMKK
jgi:hypothetical protein